jgi:hypothetical protein
MDLIASLSSQLGVNGAAAQGIAGSVLGLVKGEVAERFGEEAAGKLDSAVPELAGWQKQAAKAEAPQEGEGGGLFGAAMGAIGGGGMGGLLGAAAGALGGEQARDIAGVVTVLGRFGVDAGKAGLVAPLILDFLKKRVDPALLSKILAAAPLLASIAGGKGAAPTAQAAQAEEPEGTSAGALLGGLGKLFG